MSEQHLFKFQQENDYRIAKKNHLIVPNISTVVESGNTYINESFCSKETAEAGDIVVYHIDQNTNEVEVNFMKPEAFDQNNDYWTPDSIVVVPFSHTDDGTVRVMGLNFASVRTPSEGGDGEEIKWGDNLPQDFKTYDKFTMFSSIDAQTFEDTIGLDIEGHLPSGLFADIETSILNPFDKETFYKENYQGSIISSPYNNDGTKNEAYHSIGNFADFSGNPLKDMDGKEGTNSLLGLLDSNYLSQTLYAETIINEISTEITGVNVQLYPSAIACARYSTVLNPCTFDTTKPFEENKNTMPWYLPSAGELGYFVVRMDRINYALEQVGKTPINDEIYVPTSTVINSNTETTIVGVTINGDVVTSMPSVNSNGFYVIPFCKI